MQKFENIGDWVKKKYGGQAKAAKAMGTTQGVISQWITGVRVPGDDAQALMMKNGYNGPFPEQKAKARAAVISREEFDRWTGRIERLEADIRALLPLAVAAKDLDERVQKLERHPGSRG